MFNTPRTVFCSKRFCHSYKKKYTPSSEVTEQSIIYYKNGILAINKPYGISFSQGTNHRQDKDNVNMEVSLKTMLPFLKKHLNCENIYNVRVPEKYVSGVAILCTEQSLQQKLHKCLLRMRSESVPSDTYKSVVIGEPIKNTSNFNGVIKLETSPNSTREKRTSFLDNSSKKERIKGIAKRVTISHKTLDSNEDHSASLVEVSTTTKAWNCVRVYLSTQMLSPILGDNIYGSCIKSVLGQNVLIDRFSPVASLPQKLPPEIFTKLELKSVKDIAVPLHLHLSTVTINLYDRGINSLEFVVPLPTTFEWTCEKLGLKTNFDDLKLCESVRK